MKQLNALWLLMFISIGVLQLNAQYSVSVSPASATINDNITITFNDVCGTGGDNFWSCGQEEIYMYAGVETSAGTWQYVQGDFFTQSSQGPALANCAAPPFYITISPAAYFNIPSGVTVLGINLLFTNQYLAPGSETNNKTDDLYINLVDATVGAFSNVTVTPSSPADNQAVTIDFDATGTALAGATKVYLHSGVSTTESDPSSFNEVIGNWGADDGVGEMTNVGGNNWQIVLSSTRTYYGVDAADEIFGLNFLFRDETGTSVEANNGANYFLQTSVGDYFNLDAPTAPVHLEATATPFTTTSSSTNAPVTWTLQEVDGSDNPISTLTTQAGGTTFSHNITLASTSVTRYKVTADYGGGVVKCKFFEAKGHPPVTLATRPAGMQPGINYDAGDPTKATLILHAPTYTRYLKGTGVLGGTGTTAPKKVVYVVGDFNGWMVDDAYIMNRDRDGWNGTTDADADNDRGDYWWIELTGLTPGQEYVFQYLIDGEVQVADPYTEKVSDRDDATITAGVYSGLPTYPTQAEDRASVLQTNQSAYTWTAPPFTARSPNDLHIYELHFRDFTTEGTYLAAIDKLEYLQNMGITAIHVLPVSEFEGNSSWGYNPNFYFAPDKAYGTKDDLKKFIDECHKREILVFNDLVLNHSFYSNVMARMYWNEDRNRPADDSPFFNPRHKMVSNPGGWWGADWNHESEHVQAMVDRALNFWLQEYKFDGYRFDFTKGFGQTAPDCGDDWASTYDQDRIDLLTRMVDNMWSSNPGSIAIFEHLANSSEDKVLADHGILMWSGVGHHNDMKGFILGYDADNTNIYDSGVYNAPGRNFNFANWMSYPESHDEERLAYELLQYGNGISTDPNPTSQLAKTIDRLKIGYSFNLFLPGPRMLWEFGELGYDYSINFNGRTGEKPVRWDYYDDLKRRELYRLISKIFYIRNNYSMYTPAPANAPSPNPDYGNISWGANAITTPRYMRLHDGSGNYVIVIANLDPDASHVVTPGFQVTGTWYKHNGDLNVDGTTLNVTSTAQTYTLAPSESLVLTNFELPCSKQLAIKVYLQGPYNGTGLNTDLNTNSLVPTSEPYSALPNFTHVGNGGGEAIITNALANTGTEKIVDWVMVELRDKTDETTVIATRSGLLQADGDVVDVDGFSPLEFNVPSDDYYVVVRHRNHLGVMTAMTVTLD